MRNLNELIEKAKANLKTIVLPESTDPRVLAATAKLCRNGIAKIRLPGDAVAIERAAKAAGCDIGGAKLIDQSAHADAYAETSIAAATAQGVDP